MEFEEKTLNSEVLLNGKVVTVKKDDVELSDGSRSFREVVVHPGGVVIVALTDDNKILLVKQYRYPIQCVNLELPAGKLESGENPDLAAKRELEEETGYSAKKLEISWVYKYNARNLHRKIVFIFGKRFGICWRTS